MTSPRITYTYPAMMGVVTEMNGQNGMLNTIGSDIGSEQGVLASAWVGSTGDSFQAWQSRWNANHAELISAHRAMIQAYEQGTIDMGARDAAQGAKWV
jgi:WXG100 family type VII secretion target